MSNDPYEGVSMNPLLNPSFVAKFFPKDEEGFELVALAFYFRFHFPDGYRADKRRRAAVVCQDYWNLCGREMRWMTHPRTKYWKKVPAGYDMDQWLSAYPVEDWVWQAIFHSGRINVEAPEYLISGLGNSMQTHGHSRLYLTVPVTWFVEHPDQHPIALYRRWAGIMQATHGSAGIGLVPPEDEPRKGKTDGLVRAFSDMCPGVEIVDLSQWGIAYGGTLSPNWLTMIDQSLVDRLGGLESLERELGKAPLKEPIGFLPYEGGLILSAGERPQLYEGDEIRKPPEAYRAVAKALKPVRSKRAWGFWGYPELDESLEWLARFD